MTALACDCERCVSMLTYVQRLFKALSMCVYRCDYCTESRWRDRWRSVAVDAGALPSSKSDKMVTHSSPKP